MSDREHNLDNVFSARDSIPTNRSSLKIYMLHRDAGTKIVSVLNASFLECIKPFSTLYKAALNFSLE